MIQNKRKIVKEPCIMGILNFTPDSFFPESRQKGVKSALKRAQKMIDQGATIIDIGGESTRPGHTSVSHEEEIQRILPFIKAFHKEFPQITLSVDTYKSQTAQIACDEGATMINDIWGLQKDPQMASVVQRYGAKICIMHNRIQVDPHLNIIKDINRFFKTSLSIAKKAKIPFSDLILDPGIGFGKTQAQNYQTLIHLKELTRWNLPILLGTSRKSLFKELDGSEIEDRLGATVGTTLWGYLNGVSIFRVHDVQENQQALLFFQKVTAKDSKWIK